MRINSIQMQKNKQNFGMALKYKTPKDAIIEQGKKVFGKKIGDFTSKLDSIELEQVNNPTVDIELTLLGKDLDGAIVQKAPRWTYYSAEYNFSNSSHKINVISELNHLNKLANQSK